MEANTESPSWKEDKKLQIVQIEGLVVINLNM